MTRRDLIAAIHDKTGLTRAQCASACDAFLESVSEALNRGERVSLTRLGTLVPQSHKSQRVRHPGTGEMTTIPARVSVKFRPSRMLHDSMNAGHTERT